MLPVVDDHHPLGCHRPRIPDRLVFDQLVQIVVFGRAYQRIADATVSATTLRRRRDAWIASGLMDQLEHIVLAAYDRMSGLDLDDLVVDGCITKAPGGGVVAGRSPVDRGRLGLKRSVVVDAAGIPLGAIAAPANRHDSPLLAQRWTPRTRSASKTQRSISIVGTIRAARANGWQTEGCVGRLQ